MNTNNAIVAVLQTYLNNNVENNKNKLKQISKHAKLNLESATLLTPQLDNTAAFVAIMNPDAPLYTRTLWTKERSTENWDLIINQHYTDSDWIENFRMKKASFIKLANSLRPELEPKDLLLKSREPLSVEKQVAVALYKYCSCCEYRVVGSVFGIHKSTVMKCVYRVTEAIIKILSGLIRMPNEAEALEASDYFENVTKLPMLIGAIDGTHIPILPPTDGYRDFVNRKGWPSYNLQGLVDHRCRFINICIKYPGSTHDATVFKGSNLYKSCDRVMPKATKNFHGETVKYMIMGDPAYPLLEWLLKGYPGTVSEEEESFNAYLSSGRVVVEWAFGRLKGRFRMLSKRIDINYNFVPKVVYACCILHNFVEDEKETFVQQWLKDVENAEIMYVQPTLNHMGGDTLNAAEIRRHLCSILAACFPLKQSKLR